MKQQVRELLVTAKVAQEWQSGFVQKVDELMELVSKTDTFRNVQGASEVLDVYRKNRQKPGRLKKKKPMDCCGKPFEFLVFRN